LNAASPPCPENPAIRAARRALARRHSRGARSSHDRLWPLPMRRGCVAGKTVPCSSAPLTLKTDGRFELRGWEGNYLVMGERVELSDSVCRPRAKMRPGHK